MNNNIEHIIAGFAKAAQAAGVPENQIPALIKRSFGPEDPQAGAAPEMPPGDPAAQGLPPGVDPSAGAGAPPVDPAAAGAAPIDPSAAGGLPPESGAPQEGGDEIDQLLAQLSPEELEQLATELSQDIDGGGAGAEPQAGGEHISQLAQAIAAHLQGNPEASLGGPGAEAGAGAPPADPAAAGGLPPEAGAAPVEGADPQADPAAGGIPPEALAQLSAKQGALEFVKSAEYIESFLNRGLEQGFTVKEAVDIYDQALGVTIENLRSDVSIIKKAFFGLGKSESAPQDNGPRNATREELEAEGISPEEIAETEGRGGVPSMTKDQLIDELIAHSQGLQKQLDALSGGAQAPTPDAMSGAPDMPDPSQGVPEAPGMPQIDTKTAAYYEGLIERAREYGLSDKQAFELVQDEMSKQAFMVNPRAGQALQEAARIAEQAHVQAPHGTVPPRSMPQVQAAEQLAQPPITNVPAQQAVGSAEGKVKGNGSSVDDEELMESLRKMIKKNPINWAAGSAGAGVAGGLGLGAMMSPEQGR